MVHLFEFSLTQQILIATGALFQFGAYLVFSKECSDAQHLEEAQREREQAKAEEVRREEAARARVERPVFPKIVKYRRQVEGVMEHVPEDIRPADLLRTAKVRFKHTLEAYQGETQAMPSIRRGAGMVGR